MSPASVVAIDGPAGSGKSTLGLMLARRLGYLYFDSGVLYRALTWLALRKGVSPHCADHLARLAREMEIDILPATLEDGRACTVVVEGEDVTWALREAAVDANVSVVSAHPAVRQALLARQRAIAAKGSVVMVGRDIGTIVAPGADLKFFLEASLEVRARRRLRDLVARGRTDVSLDEVKAEIEERDRIDATRATAPLAKADDAVTIDNGDRPPEEVVAEMERLARSTTRK